MAILIADSGSTKCEWVLVNNRKKKTILTQGINPYFLSAAEIKAIINNELVTSLGKAQINAVYFYGAGLGNSNNASLIKKILQSFFKTAVVEVATDLLAAARSLCMHQKGIVCILGTGSNSCFYNGKKIVQNIPGLGFILGDEGSGAYLGKKVIQHYLYQTFDEELLSRFDKTFATNKLEILESVYQKALPNRYLASFTNFLAENRGHYMIENIIEDGLNDFFFTHLYKYKESWTHPIHFVGSVAYGFKDVLHELCSAYELELGKIVQKPVEGLIKYHAQ